MHEKMDRQRKVDCWFAEIHEPLECPTESPHSHRQFQAPRASRQFAREDAMWETRLLQRL